MDLLVLRLDQFEKRFNDLVQTMNTRFDGFVQAVNTRFDDQRLTLDARLADLGQRISGVEGRLSAVENRMASSLTVNLWGATISMLIAAAVAIIKLWS
jgi:hypothetical protein